MMVMDPWARPTVAVQKTGAAYLTLHNAGETDDRLTGARSAVAEKVSLHESSIDAAGIARMRPVAAIDAPAGGMVELTPGGVHLMLEALREPLEKGSSFPLTLVFEKAGEVTVEVRVEDRRQRSGEMDHPMHGQEPKP
jgi:copper(I)-binding protein